MKQLTQLLLSGLLALVLAGCTSPSSHFYTLNAAAKSNGAPSVNCSVIVGPVFIPAAVNRPEFVITLAANQVEFNEFNRWDAPLNDGIARVVSTDLGVLLGTQRVTTGPMPDFGPAYQVTIRVERFESVLGKGKQNGEALVDALWAVRGPTGQNAGSGRTTAREPVPGKDFEALAAAHGQALAKLSSDIAEAIRVDAGKMP
jgi:uncharacterized lipoprotein YmbA